MPKLLLNIAKQSSQHQPILLRLAVASLEALSQAPSLRDAGTEEEFAAKYPFLQSSADQQSFLAFATKMMLYQPAALLPRVAAPASHGSAGVQVQLLGELLMVSISCKDCTGFAQGHTCCKQEDNWARLCSAGPICRCIWTNSHGGDRIGMQCMADVCLH